MDIFSLCSSGSSESVEKLLLQHNDFVHIMETSRESTYRGTPLMFAVRYQRFDIAKTLINYGADVNATCGNQSALTIAVMENLMDIIKLLLENGAKVRGYDFLQSLKDKRWEIAEYLLGYDVNLFHVDSLGNSYLHYIVANNALKLANAVLKKNPNCWMIKNSDGKNALALAEELQLDDMVVLLKPYTLLFELEKKSNILKRELEQKTTTLKMCEEGKLAIACAQKEYIDKMTFTENLKPKITATENTLKGLQVELEIAEREQIENKLKLREEIERATKVINEKPPNRNLLECPICFEIPFHPRTVLQCTDGHCICSECRKKVKNCPECRQELKDPMVRNRRVEALIHELKISPYT